MTTLEAIEGTEKYIELFEELSKGEDLWLEPQRKSAFEQFAANGVPSHRRDEDWRHTNLAPLTANDYTPAGDYSVNEAEAAVIRKQFLAIAGGPKLVFINGKFNADLSATDGLPNGVTISTIAAARAAVRRAREPAPASASTRRAG